MESTNEAGKNIQKLGECLKSMSKSIGAAVIGAALLVGAGDVQASERTYEVESGDTLSEIAHIQGTTVSAIVEANPEISDADLIFPSQELTVPSKSQITAYDDEQASKDDSSVSLYETPQSTPVKHVEGNEALLARLIESEASGEPFAGKVAVGNVVMNRVASDIFPNTVRSVIYQHGQFNGVSNGMIHQPASLASVKAAREAITTGGNIDGALFFYNPTTATNRWLDSRHSMYDIGNHLFKR